MATECGCGRGPGLKVSRKPDFARARRASPRRSGAPEYEPADGNDYPWESSGSRQLGTRYS